MWRIIRCALVLLIADDTMVNFRVLSRAMATTVKSFEANGVVPDVVPVAPWALLSLTYPSGVEVKEGNVLSPTQATDVPMVQRFRFPRSPDQNYTPVNTTEKELRMIPIMSDRIFYEQVARFWEKRPPNLRGVTGTENIKWGTIDIEGSRNFLLKVFKMENPPERKLALDCGAGIGRVSKELLVHYFDTVDLVERDLKYINNAKQSLAEFSNRVGSFYRTDALDFKPQKKYDVIWIQWVLGYLTDYDAIWLLSHLASALNKKGVIIVKDNIAPRGERKTINFQTYRPVNQLLKLFIEAKLAVVYMEEHEEYFGSTFQPQYMFALIPKSRVIIV